jgi:hypothetical protein
MAHPARRVMPNGPVGRKLQHFKCTSMSRASQAVHMPICEVAAEYEPPAPPCAWEVRWGAVSGYMTPVDSISVGRFDRKLAPQRLFPQPPPRRAPGLYRPNAAASARTDLVRSDLAWWLGHGETGPYGLTPSARPNTANTRTASGPARSGCADPPFMGLLVTSLALGAGSLRRARVRLACQEAAWSCGGPTCVFSTDFERSRRGAHARSCFFALVFIASASI